MNQISENKIIELPDEIIEYIYHLLVIEEE